MEDNKIEIKRAHILDVPEMMKLGLLQCDVEEAQEQIRAQNKLSVNRILVLKRKNEYLSFVRFLKEFSLSDSEICDISFAKSIIGDSYTICKILDLVVQHAFFTLGIHKIKIVISPLMPLLEKAALSVGFTQEAVLHDELLVNGKHIDCGLFSLLMPEYTGYGVVFVPFQRGVVALSGTQTYVDSVNLLKYEGQIEDKLTYETAEYVGILDDEGRLFPKNSNCYQNDFSIGAPNELSNAATQLSEYFCKRREQFDVNISFTKGTDFQMRVWNELLKIPYGATRSYEDVALSVTDNNLAEARKLTRAVGSACSENPIPILVPCHRVIGKDGRLVGYSCGVEFKDFLLQHEAFSFAAL